MAEEEHRDALSLFASRLSHRRFGGDELRVLEAALSAGGDVPALLATRSVARRLLRASAAEAFPATGPVEDVGRRLAVADFFARAFALVGDVESCLAMRYEALVLREAKYSDDLHLQVSREEWLTFASKLRLLATVVSATQFGSNLEVSSRGIPVACMSNLITEELPNAFANALAHLRPSHPGHLDSTISIEEKDNTNYITGLQNLAKSLSAQHSVQTQSAEYMKRRASSGHEKCNLQSGKPKLPGVSMFRLGIKTRNMKKLLHSQERNSGEI
ncbi:hypothetical protein ACP70R_008996 [Stipagrostis hirtigluma subsp. patula]